MGSLPPLTADAIALTEKKMDMTLDDIIKMSKKTKQKPRKQRSSNKSQRPYANKFGAMDKASKAHVQQSVAARSSALRQAKLAEMRSRNGNNQFPAVKEAARRVATARSVQGRRSVARSVQGRTAVRTVQGRSVQGRSVARSVQWNKRRNGSFSVQSSRAFPMVSSTQVNAPMKQRPQTLDSLFANMKEQRLRAQAQVAGRQTNNFANNKRNFGGRQRNFDGYRRNFMGRQSQRANQV